MIFKGNVYVAYVDGIFAGIAEDEYEITDVANDFVNGVSKPLYDDDMADRVWYDIINVNRWYYYDEHNCSDKLSNKNIMCYDQMETINCVNIMNKENLQKERAEAKLRAMAL